MDQECCDGESYFEDNMEMCSKCHCPHNREYERQEILLNASAVSYCGGGRWKIEQPKSPSENQGPHHPK